MRFYCILLNLDLALVKLLVELLTYFAEKLKKGAFL